VKRRRRAAPAQIPAVLTTEELAAILRTSAATIRRLNLPALEAGRGRWRYVWEQVAEELKQRAKRGLGVPRRVA